MKKILLFFLSIMLCSHSFADEFSRSSFDRAISECILPESKSVTTNVIAASSNGQLVNLDVTYSLSTADRKICYENHPSATLVSARNETCLDFSKLLVTKERKSKFDKSFQATDCNDKTKTPECIIYAENLYEQSNQAYIYGAKRDNMWEMHSIRIDGSAPEEVQKDILSCYGKMLVTFKVLLMSLIEKQDKQ